MSKSRPAMLSSALLARKGDATPTGYTPIRAQEVNASTAKTGHPVSTPVSVIKPDFTAIGGRLSADSERARVSVRLDPDRHLKLRLTAAHLHNSLQDIMIDALDRYLEQIGPEVLRNDCACLNFKNSAEQRNWQSD
jgi:hypothetical protein